MNLSIMILHNCLFLWIAKTQSFMRVQGFSPVDSSNLSLFYMFSLFFFFDIDQMMIVLPRGIVIGQGAVL